MGGPSSSSDDGRLRRCIRDLAALNALPSMCIGRSPDQALEIVMNVLPTALGCQLIYLSLPGPWAKERAALGGKSLGADEIGNLRASIADEADETSARVIPGAGRLWCVDAAIPIGAEHGRLLAGRRTPLDLETDRVLVRSAANLVGTTLDTANVLEAARRRDEFLAMLGHELRNPLSPIITAVELLKVRGIEAIEKERIVIERQARHMARLVDDLLDVSRVASGKITLAKEPIELSGVIATALEMSRAIVAERRHRLEVDVERTGLMVDADPSRLAQAISNLLINAAKYTEPEGSIRLSASRHGRLVEIDVVDTGIGIEPEMLGRVFEPFVQERQALDRARGGLGIGLAIVRSLVTLHGGTVEAKSAGRGKGTKMSIRLPLLHAALPTADLEGAPEAVMLEPGLRILIVDDNRDAAELLVEYLGSKGHEVRMAHDGPEGLSMALDFVPDVALLDIGLPSIDGYEVARRIREQEKGHRMRLIALTGYGQETDRRRAQEASFDGHLVKPVTMARLEEMLFEGT